MSNWQLLPRRYIRRPEQSRLYDQIWQTDTLTRAWREVRRGGGIGVDGLTVADFEAHWPEHMAELAATLREKRYQPLPLRSFTLARPDGRTRPIALLSLRDRIVQRAVLDVVQPRFASAASPAAFGALRGRGVEGALDRVRAARESGLTWVVRTDIRAFFERVEHGRMLETFATITEDSLLTDLVRRWLLVSKPVPFGTPTDAFIDSSELGAFGRPSVFHLLQDGLDLARTLEDHWVSSDIIRLLAAPVFDAVPRRWNHWRPVIRKRLPYGAGLGVLLVGALATKHLLGGGDLSVLRQGERGTPQGAPLSPLLATSVLNALDHALERPGQVFVRYVDDLLIICIDERQARKALASARREVARLGLTLNESKTTIGHYDAGFTFLGSTLPHGKVSPPDDTELGPLAADFRNTPYWEARRRWDASSRRPPVARRRTGKRGRQ